MEGYVESIASGLLAGVFASAELTGRQVDPPPPTTALGGLYRHTRLETGRFQPSNVVWAMIDTPPRQRRQKKREHRLEAATRALEEIGLWRGRSTPEQGF